MKKNLLLVLLVTLSTEAAAACGRDPALIAKNQKFEISMPVFVFERNGRFLRGNLATGEWKVISDHGFEEKGNALTSGVTVVQSPDGHWIAYSGTIKDREYWLYDKRTGSERRYHRNAAGGIPEIRFSPDSKRIALHAGPSYHNGSPPPEDMSLYMADVESAQAAAIAIPSKFNEVRFEPKWVLEWSRDGSQLLLAVLSFHNVASEPGRSWVNVRREYFSYAPRGRSVQRIAGRLDRQELDQFLRPDKSVIPQFDPPRPQSAASRKEMKSPDGRWTATIVANIGLAVHADGGAVVKYATSKADACGPEALHINGWLDSRHVVYTLNGYGYVFDTATDNQGAIYPVDRPQAFLW